MFKWKNRDPDLPPAERFMKLLFLWFFGATVMVVLGITLSFLPIPKFLSNILLTIYMGGMMWTFIHYGTQNHPLPFAISWEEEQRRKAKKAASEHSDTAS